MKSPAMPRRVMDRFEVGTVYHFRRTFTDADAALFIGATWDVNPYHTDEVFCSQLGQ